MEIEQMRNELRLLEKEFGEIKEILNEVHTAIIGNPLTKDGGMVARLITAEQQLEKLELRVNDAEKKQVKYNVYTRLMWLLSGGIISIIFAYILELIFKKPL